MGTEEAIEEFIGIWETAFADDTLDPTARSEKLDEVLRGLMKRKIVAEHRKLWVEIESGRGCKVYVDRISGASLILT